MEDNESTDAELRREFVAQLSVEMMQANWLYDVAREGSAQLLAAFRQPVVGDFWATLSCFPVGPGIAGEAPLRIESSVGIDFQPAYRLAPLVAGRPPAECCEVDVASLAPGEGLDPLVIWSLDQAADLAGELAGPVVEHAAEHARRFASLDALVDDVRGLDLLHLEVEEVPLLLAAGGRHAEALEALAGYEVGGSEEVTDREFRRFARQLRLWIEAGGRLPDPPTSPVLSAQAVPPSTERQIRDREASHARRAVYESCRPQAPDLSDDELRSLLQTRLTERGLAADALGIETAITGLRIQSRPFGNWITAAQGTTAVVGGINRQVRLLRSLITGAPLETTIPGESPNWLEPPAEAAYPSRGALDDWRPVAINPDIHAYLRDIHRRLPRALIQIPGLPQFPRTAIFEAWLSDPEPHPGTRTPATVHVGNRSVGSLSTADTANYRAVLEAASARNEQPYVSARLTQLDHPPTWLLEINGPGRPL